MQEVDGLVVCSCCGEPSGPEHYCVQKEIKHTPDVFKELCKQNARYHVQIKTLQDQLAAEQAKVEELQAISYKQQTIMLQAHDEIEKYWDAHTDPTGYGPNTLMNNLQKKRVSDCYPSRCPFVSLSLDRDKVTHEELSSLANVLWEKFYKDVSPDFELFDRTDLAVSQINNMVAGIVSKLQRAEKVIEAAWYVDKFPTQEGFDELHKVLVEYERESE